MARDLMDQIVRAKVAKNADNKRKWEDNQRVNFGYVGTLPYCNKCKLHHNGPCLIQCGNCKKISHQAKDCRTSTPIMNIRIPRTCFECGAKRNFKNDCPRLRNQNGGIASGKAFVLGEGEAHKDLNIVTLKKLEEARLKDVPVVRDCLKVFPKDFPGL
uniref:Putative reverse transcriptase domain-containing protein n=1 Tax=Tanacetum cinerariifolium TaxID=118510 RepID=A0A6L2KH21_TANCI|nr:putative reverse transcriptase domain-containing protein [Tanacetum cinerariifolium]